MALIITLVNGISILLLTVSYRRMVKFTKTALRKELRKTDSNSKVDLKKCLMD